MGSFNTSCFVSQQIVQPGDEVVLFPIVQVRGHSPVEVVVDPVTSKTVALFGISNSMCYQNAFWEYAGPTLSGVYDDYGRFTLVDDPQNLRHVVSFFETLHTHLCQVKAGENQYHDLPLSFRDLFDPVQTYDFDALQTIWGTLSELAGEQRLFLRMRFGADDVRPLAFAVVHRATFEHTRRIREEYTDYGTPAGLEACVRRALGEKYEETFSALSKGSAMKGMARILGRNLDKADFVPVGADFHLDQYYPLGDVDLFHEVYGAPSLDAAVATFLSHRKAMCEHLYFCGGLELVGVRLTPQVYAGQDYDNAGGNLFLKLVQRVNQDVNARILRDD